MKKYILYFIINLVIGCFSINSIYAITCDPVCKSTKFVYLGCDMTTHRKTAICTNDPRNTPNFRPWKKCFPMTIVVESWPRTDWDTWYSDLNNDNAVQSNEWIFEKLQSEAILYNGLDNWAAICTPDNQNCDNCSPHIIWAQREEEMKSFPGALAITYQEPDQAGGTGCGVNCLFNYIAINMTDRFLDVPVGSIVPRNWYYTNRTGPHSDVEWYDLQSVIEHEMGHWLGFEDYQQRDCNSSYSGMMNSPLYSNTTESISSSDRCMFQKLYCCPSNSTSVKEEDPIIDSDFNIFPNPTKSDVTISLSPSTSQYIKKLRIVDVGGKTVFEQIYPVGNSDCIVHTNGLSKGTYLFVMTFEGINGSYAEKVIIQ